MTVKLLNYQVPDIEQEEWVLLLFCLVTKLIQARDNGLLESSESESVPESNGQKW